LLALHLACDKNATEADLNNAIASLHKKKSPAFDFLNMDCAMPSQTASRTGENLTRYDAPEVSC
jgi:hypothetical protein